MCDLTANRSDLAPMAVHGRTLRRESRLNLIRMRGPSTDTLFLFLFLSVSYFPPNARSPHPILPYAVHRDVPNKPLTWEKDLKEREKDAKRKRKEERNTRERKRENSQSLVRPDSFRSRLVLVRISWGAGRSQHGHYGRYAATASDPNSSRPPAFRALRRRRRSWNTEGGWS